MSNRVLVTMAWIAIAWITMMAATIIAWLIIPYQVTTIQEPIQILNPNKEVRIGEKIVQELKINKPNEQAPTEPTRLLLCDDGNLVTLAALPNVLNLPLGKYTLINDRYVLPPKVSPGSTCVFVWRQSYQVNPTRKIPVEWRSEPFTIKEKL